MICITTYSNIESFQMHTGFSIYPRIQHVILMEVPLTHVELSVLREFILGNVVWYLRGGVSSPFCIPQFWNATPAQSRLRYVPPPQPSAPPPTYEEVVVDDEVIVIIDDDVAVKDYCVLE